MDASDLAAQRRRAGYTQVTFAAAFAAEAVRLGIGAGVSVRQLARWEKPDPPLPHAGQQAVLEALLGVPLHELGFTVPPHRRSVCAPMGETERVRRRRFVTDVTTAAGATVLVPRGAGGSRVGAADVRALRGRLAGLYTLDHARGGGTARVRALELGREIDRRLNRGSCTERVSRDLQLLRGEVSSHLAWFGRDAGLEKQARAACLEAMATARMVDDVLLEVRALASMSLLAADAGRAWEASSAAQAAHTLAHRRAGPTVHLVLALREAGAAQVAGDLSTARRALSRALSLLGRTDVDTDVPAWAVFARSTVEVDYAQGRYYEHAGQPAAAVPYLRSAVRGLGGGYTRNTALYRSRLGRVLAAAGDVEEACAEVHAVLDGATGVHSAKLAEEVMACGRAVAGADTATARALLERIRHESERGSGVWAP
ncbi:hypothetical protein [Embleya sp. NBC_00896]|uniref:hypothetical protein n=1 Tax=Embleya sp. NBC_00896 TaxID=2975961 RepID=UPI002F90B488|nr:hypothetical protein OG928_47870 [Embleya sp. NBC_00896]